MKDWGLRGVLKESFAPFLSSAKKHLKTGGKEGLKARIDRTLRELYDMADWFRGDVILRLRSSSLSMLGLW